MSREELAALLEKAATALADIALSDDLSESTRRNKARRVYEEIRAVWEGPGPDDVPPPAERG